jgi:Na+-transporting methylmalonyl-CoA/oxaloacetate decarboxylase gamma subunit
MYVILLLLMLILFSYGYSVIEPMSKKKEKKKEKNRNEREAASAAAEESGMEADPVCAQNADDIENIRDQLGEISELKNEMDMLKQTIQNNDIKIQTILQKVQTMV